MHQTMLEEIAPDWEMLDIERCSRLGDARDSEMLEIGRYSRLGDARDRKILEIDGIRNESKIGG